MLQTEIQLQARNQTHNSQRAGSHQARRKERGSRLIRGGGRARRDDKERACTGREPIFASWVRSQLLFQHNDALGQDVLDDHDFPHSHLHGVQEQRDSFLGGSATICAESVLSW